MSRGKDEFGDRMKYYESMEAGRRFLPMLPVIARLDGKNFSRWTKGLKRPYDERMNELMKKVTVDLVTNTNANIGYTQSDEITLGFYSNSFKSQIFFDGRIMKLTSVLASMATAYFNDWAPKLIPEREGYLAYFDCRVWQLPNLVEGTNAILWRELDATKNSVSMAARHYYSHQQLHGLGRADMMDLLHAKGVNWNDYPVFFKRGVYVQRHKEIRKFTADEIEDLPEQHEARTNPNLEVERTDTLIMDDMPPLAKVINRTEVLFFGDDPIVESEWEDGHSEENSG